MHTTTLRITDPKEIKAELKKLVGQKVRIQGEEPGQVWNGDLQFRDGVLEVGTGVIPFERIRQLLPKKTTVPLIMIK